MSVLHVAFKVAGVEYVLPASRVVHVESFDGATKVPGTPDFVAGLVHTRGQMVPVVDLRARFGLPPVEPALDHRILVIQHEGRTIALLADSAREVLDIEEEAFREPPELILRESAGLVEAVAHVAERTVMLINLPKVIGEGAHAE